MNATTLVNTTEYIIQRKPVYINYSIIAVPVLLSLGIITGNGMVIGACCHLSKKTSRTVSFILALSIADFATGVGMIINVFMRVPNHLLSQKFPCLLSYEIFSTMALISMNLLACTTFDRFLSIYKHEKQKEWNTQKSVNIQICCSYFCGFAIGFLPFLGLNRWESGMKCAFKDIYPSELYFIKSSAMFVGFGVSFVLYVFILRKAWRVHNGRHIEVLHTAAMRQRNNFILAKLVGIITILNSICWMPYSFMIFLCGITNQAIDATHVVFALLLLGFTTSFINPVIYALNRKDFRAVWRNWCRCCSR
ncbi:G-protein coupled receptor 6-like [Ostrea edulis]|uniref:G-protein coupled receptor 6-like n=1 Tax=Ostrea edulis TaxID=37623 RepID=UPI0024AFBE99|nr:G-protein coupled receptor 6-like [Ostrea edulis]